MASYRAKILLVDDDKFFCEIKSDILTENGYLVRAIHTANEVLPILEKYSFDLLLLDLKLGDDSGLEVLKQVKQKLPDIVVIMITSVDSTTLAVEAIKEGAYDYLQKSIKNEELFIKIDNALEKHKNSIEISLLKEALTEGIADRNIIGNNPKIKKILELVDKISESDATALILGETGTGKELVARAIHNKSNRAHEPFIALNCAAITETLMESELFGHERGSFTGAIKQRIGKIEIAKKGTLFLDEIGDMSTNLQAKLLRFLQDKTFERVGGNDTLTSSARIIAATNQDLDNHIKENKFRKDLYYRLNVVHFDVPPLRERTEDLPLLANYFISIANKRNNKNIQGISQEGLKALKEYSWPGNIRELENLLERLILISDNNIIDENHIIPFLKPEQFTPQKNTLNIELDVSLREARAEFEKIYFENLLQKYHGNITLIREKSQMDRKSVFNKLKSYGLQKEQYK